jgi:glycosyltransferase involved in cell wall biosynthesis
MHIDLVTSSLTKRTYEMHEYLPGVRIFRVPVNNRNIHHSTNRELLTYAWRALILSSKMIRHSAYDVCLAFSTVPAGGVALALWTVHRLPFLVRVGGPDIPGFEQRYALVTRLLSPSIRLTWRNARRVIVKCDHERGMVESACSHAHLVVIPNAVDSERFRPRTPERTRKDGTIQILCVARLIERKGQHHLLQSVRLLADRGHGQFKVVLVGEGDAEAALKAQAHALGVETLVDFRGYVPRTNMPVVYSSADIFALPSFNEGMSVATLEAMASGLPLVVTRNSGLEELVSGNGITFTYGDILALADALEQLLLSCEQRQQMGHRSRELALGYSWEQVGCTYAHLLTSIATMPE